MSERISRAELRDLLVAHGKHLLLEEGMKCGVEHLTFPAVFGRIEEDTGRRVTRASVYDRIWRSQAEYQWECLAEVIEDASSVDDRTRRWIRRILDRADTSSPEGRWAAVSELSQVAVRHNVIEASRRQPYRIVAAAAGSIASSVDPVNEPPYVTKVRDALRTYLEKETDLYHELFGTIGYELGFRLKAPFELRHFVLAVGALSEGMTLRLSFYPELGKKIRAPGEPPDARAEWSIVGVGVAALAHHMLEIDPDWPHE